MTHCCTSISVCLALNFLSVLPLVVFPDAVELNKNYSTEHIRRSPTARTGGDEDDYLGPGSNIFSGEEHLKGKGSHKKAGPTSIKVDFDGSIAEVSISTSALLANGGSAGARSEARVLPRGDKGELTEMLSVRHAVRGQVGSSFIWILLIFCWIGIIGVLVTLWYNGRDPQDLEPLPNQNGSPMSSPYKKMRKTLQRFAENFDMQPPTATEQTSASEVTTAGPKRFQNKASESSTSDPTSKEDEKPLLEGPPVSEQEATLASRPGESSLLEAQGADGNIVVSSVGAEDAYVGSVSNLEVEETEPKVGERITTLNGESFDGVVRFVGATDFAPGRWVGIELTEPCGKNDGSVMGRRYFECEQNHGVFVRKSLVQVEKNWSAALGAAKGARRFKELLSKKRAAFEAAVTSSSNDPYQEPIAVPGE